MSWETFWSMITAIAGLFAAVAASVYAGYFIKTVTFLRTQTQGFEKTRRLEIVLTIFRELKTKDFMAKRRYIYDHVPKNIEGIDDNQLKKYLIRVETALTAFERVGYLLKENHIDAKPIMDLYWASIWRCWRKCRNIIFWARTKREQKGYFRNFQYLARLSERYRKEKRHDKPKFYPLSPPKTPSRIIVA